MHSELSINIKATLPRIFETAADLENWPAFLPHYIRNDYFSRSPWGGIINMSCHRPPFKLAWTSIYRIDRANRTLYFEHLRPLTRGMKVLWRFESQPDQSIRVVIVHDFSLPWPVIGPFIARFVVGHLLIDHVAKRTLCCLKAKVEANS